MIILSSIAVPPYKLVFVYGRTAVIDGNGKVYEMKQLAITALLVYCYINA